MGMGMGAERRILGAVSFLILIEKVFAKNRCARKSNFLS